MTDKRQSRDCQLSPGGRGAVPRSIGTRAPPNGVTRRHICLQDFGHRSSQQSSAATPPGAAHAQRQVARPARSVQGDPAL
ncbi:MAG: hypothetical protein ACRDJ5_02505, partial [Actinomycetota bacterium]